MSHIEEKDIKNLEGGEHVESLEYNNQGRRPTISQDYNQFIGDAVDAVEGQKSQAIGDALRMYKKGIIYSIIFSA